MASCRGLPFPDDIGEVLTDAVEQIVADLHVAVDGLTLQAVMSPDRIDAGAVRELLRRSVVRIVRSRAAGS